MVQLSDLCRALGGRVLAAGSAPGADPRITDVVLDSREVAQGALFAALGGGRVDGLAFAPAAQERGAAALLCEQAPAAALGLPAWVHPEARRAAGEAAARVHGDPSRALHVIGVTGTNGKTTTTWLAAQLLERAGLAPALIGTVEYRLAGGVQLDATHTTPDAPRLQRLLARHLAAGGRSACIELSSHGLEQQRHAGLALATAVFTNLTRDHLDYHGDMASYARAKARLFEALPRGAHAVIHAGVEGADVMERAARAAGAQVFTYSAGSRADLRASRVSVETKGCRFSIQGMGVDCAELFLPLVGRHNVENALAALAAALLSGASPEALLSGLAAVLPAPGRLERVPLEREFEVLVDYAHTPDGLERVLGAVRELLAEQRARRGRSIAVFGCGGNRDSGKRAPMGALAGRLADVVVVTSDNPRDEDPLAIIAEIRRGLAGTPAEVHVEADRRSAIALALSLARAGDVVLIAGKGHERVQIARGVSTPFEDARVAREVLA